MASPRLESLDPAEARKDAKLTVSAAALALQCGRRSLQRYEDRSRTPDAALLYKMSTLYGLTDSQTAALARFWREQ